jgi:SAM-dependent methyltransferase
MAAHDPESYWNAKAEASAYDPLGAVAHGDPLRDRCIDRVQQRLMRLALDALMSSGGRLPTGGVLDLGCGTGRWVPLLERRGLAYHGIDISGRMVEIARREHPGARFEKFDGQSFPFGAASFTLVLSMAVIHHNTYPRQERLLDEIVRVLEPGGALLLMEGIGPRAASDEGVFFYRPVADWSKALADRGLVLGWQRGARYFAAEHIGTALLGRAGLSAPRLSRPLLRLGAWVDPWLIAARPNRLHDRWMALWRKPEV